MRLLPRKYDQPLFFAVLGILTISLIMIASIGVPKSIDLSAPNIPYPDCSYESVDCYLVLKNHAMRVLIGVVAMFLAWKLPFKIWKKASPLVFGFGLVLMGYVLISGDSNNTFAKAWINLPGVPFVNSLQPSEIVKLGLILYLSYVFTERITTRQLQDFKEGFLKFAAIAGVPVLLILMQPDIGGATVIAFIATAIYLVAGADLKHIAIGALIAFMGASIAVAKVDHVNERFLGFVSREESCKEDFCWQSRQADIAIGSGGAWGKGLTQGVQKSYWLPEATSDFIFAASAEEIGFFRTVFLVLLYAVIAYRGYWIASRAPNMHATLVATGITTWITAQAFINIMVNTKLFPITGLTLPFMSYGGSSMVTTLLAVGILLNISSGTNSHENSFNGGWDRRPRHSQSRYRSRYSR